MKRARLLALAAGAAALVTFPLTASAASFTTLTVTPSTHSQYGTTHTVYTTNAHVLKSSETVLPAGAAICNRGQTCAPADNTKIGTTSVSGTWLPFCTSGNFSFDATWVANDGSYTPPTGWSIVAQINNVGSLATVKSWVIKDASANYKIEVPSYPSLTCDNHTATLDTTIGTFNSTNYTIYQNPATTGSATFTINDVYTNNSTASTSKSYTVS